MSKNLSYRKATKDDLANIVALPDQFTMHEKIVPFIIATCLFMENLDSTIINSAIPTMA